MKQWTLRDTVVTILLLLAIILLFMQMVQSDRLYERVNRMISLVERVAERPVVMSPGSSEGSNGRSQGSGGGFDVAATQRLSLADDGLIDPNHLQAVLRANAGDWCIRILQEPESLNPITASDYYESIINGFVFESLLGRDNVTLAFKPLLAKRWEVSADKMHYRFWIDPRAKWSDGTPVTADDVVFTYHTIMNPGVACPHLKVYYKDITACRKIDEHAVEFDYAKLYWRALTFCGGMTILPRHIYGFQDPNEFNLGFHDPNDPDRTNLNRSPAGSGPYRFVKWEAGARIVLERDDEYWRQEEELPALQRMVFRFLDQDQARLQVLKAREADVLDPLSAEQWVEETKEPEFDREFRRIKYLDNGFRYIGWNMRRPFFADRRCRLAMTHLVPREEILARVEHNLGMIVTGPANCKTAAYDKSIKPYPYDPQAAKRLLDEAGWTDHDGDGVRDKNGAKFKFEISYPSGLETYQKIVSIVQEECRKVGIDMSGRMLEWSVLLEKIDAREFDAVMLGWSTPLEFDPYQIWHSSQTRDKGHNYVGFVNPEVDDLIQKAREEFDEAARNRLFYRFHEIIHQEQPYTFLFARDRLIAADRRFKNTRVYVGGLDYTEWFVPLALQRYR